MYYLEKSLSLRYENIKNSNTMQRFTKTIAAIMLMMAMFFATGCTEPDDPSSVEGSLNGHDYVDLGLPSGTLWATCNVGADTHEDYGDYFAWGETEPKTTYDWGTYKWCNGDYDQLNKYCTDSNYGYNGFIDNLTVLQPSDDAATANWGTGWYMPTEAQWKELYQNTTNTWITQNGVNGSLFTGSNGRTLFLPAAGYHGENGLDHVNSNGHYWSSLLDTSIPYGVGVFSCFSIGYGYSSGSRDQGRSVRAVCSARQN